VTRPGNCIRFFAELGLSVRQKQFCQQASYARVHKRKGRLKMSKYVKYWLTPNQEARYEVHRMYGKDSLYYKAVTELVDIEKPFDSPAWKAWCTSDAEFKDIVAAAAKVRERFGTKVTIQQGVDKMLALAKSDGECQTTFRQLNLTEHDSA
jgi:hypothetical protein